MGSSVNYKHITNVATGTEGQTLKVGSGQRFKTIQQAVDYIEDQSAFVALSLYQEGIVGTWNQSSDVITLSTAALSAAGQFVTPVPIDRLWCQAAGDTYYYPVESVSGAAIGSELISVGIPRHEANASGSPQLTFYRENNFLIELTDDYYAENITFSTNQCVTIKGNGKTLLDSFLSGTIASGRITFTGVVHTKTSAGGAIHFNTSASATTFKLEFFHSELSPVQDDYIYPSTGKYGSVTVDFCTCSSQPTGATGHFIAPGNVYGDVRVTNLIWKLKNHSAIANAALSDATLVDKALSARNVYIHDVYAIVDDPHNDFGSIRIAGCPSAAATASTGPSTGNWHVNNCHILCWDTTTANFAIFGFASSANGLHLNIDNCSIVAPNTSGAIQLVGAKANPTGACTVTLGRGNLINDCASSATYTNITYTIRQAQAAGTATVANTTTSIAVTHGLGYTPRAEDINIIPTLLSNSAKWWVTAVGATTFTINVDADPGAGTATFAWKIGV